MVAVGVCPTLTEHFDRALYPVRYYYVDFSKAVRIDHSAKSISPFREDVKDCGLLIDKILADVRPSPHLRHPFPVVGVDIACI